MQRRTAGGLVDDPPFFFTKCFSKSFRTFEDYLEARTLLLQAFLEFMNPDNTGRTGLSDESPEMLILPRIAAREKNAFRECVEKHGDMIWRLAKNYADSEARAETMTLEIFRELWQCAAGFDPERCAEEVFIRRIAYRRLLKARENP